VSNCTTGKGWTLHVGDSLAVLRTMPDESVNCCVTSPPYWNLRDYQIGGQIGLEETPGEYIARLVDVFREVRRVLRSDGVLWLNLGDSYNSAASNQNGRGLDGKTRGGNNERGRTSRIDATLKPKDLIGIPWRAAFALQADGWTLRQDCIWHKSNPMPESVRDRCTKAHEYMFLLSKSARYWWDAGAMAEPALTSGESRVTVDHGGGGYQAISMGRKPSGNQIPGTVVVRGPTRNRRSVWTISTRPYKGVHFATFPPKLVEPCILAGCPEQCCTTCGAGWVRVVEKKKPPVELYTSSRKPDGIKPCSGGGGMGQKLQDWYNENPPVTLGWQPSCTCNTTDATPGIVLDPFAGSGTTLAVAIQHGRQAIGIELNPKYAAECAVPRIMATEAR
jgi:DNA modification methylase